MGKLHLCVDLNVSEELHNAIENVHQIAEPVGNIIIDNLLKEISQEWDLVEGLVSDQNLVNPVQRLSEISEWPEIL